MANPYATRTDLANFMRAPVLARASIVQQDAALDASADEANGFLRSRFFLPLATHGAALTRHVCNMAAYDLIFQLGFNPDGGADPNWRLRREDAIDWLKAVSNNKITPDGMTSGARPSVNTDGSPITGQPTVDGSVTDDSGAPAFTSNAIKPRGW